MHLGERLIDKAAQRAVILIQYPTATLYSFIFKTQLFSVVF